jgi:chromosome partitioning protein
VSEALAEYELPVLKSHVCQRVIFAESAAIGSTVIEHDPNSTASAEIRALVDEILRLKK